MGLKLGSKVSAVKPQRVRVTWVLDLSTRVISLLDSSFPDLVVILVESAATFTTP